MNVRATAVQGALAAVGLTAAYLAWQHPAQNDAAGKITVVGGTKSTLERVRYERKEQWFELSRETAGSEPEVWIHRGYPGGVPVAAAPPAPAPDGGTPAHPTPPPPKFKAGAYKASERASKLEERLAPLLAQRSLGKLPEDKLKEFGLESSDRRLELTVSGARRAFKVAPSEGGGMYLFDEQDGQTWLVSGGVLSDLDAPEMLVDKRLHAFERSEVDGFTVVAAGKSRSYVQKPGEAGIPLMVAPEDKPDQADEQVRNWQQKVWSRMSASQLLPKGEAPEGGEPEVALRVDFLSRHKAKGFVEIAKAKTGNTWLARTEHTAGWAQVNGAEDVVNEATKFLSGEAAAPAKNEGP